MIYKMKEESKIKSFVLRTISMIINDKIMSRIFYKFGGLSVVFFRGLLLYNSYFLGRVFTDIHRIDSI